MDYEPQVVQQMLQQQQPQQQLPQQTSAASVAIPAAGTVNEASAALANTNLAATANSANANATPSPSSTAVATGATPTAPIIVTVNTGGAAGSDPASASATGPFVTIPVPIVPQEDTFVYIMVKGSLHDRSCQVFGLNEEETQAVGRRFENSVKTVVNGIMVGVTPTAMINTLAQLNYKVICASGEAEICWTMQREV